MAQPAMEESKKLQSETVTKLRSPVSRPKQLHRNDYAGFLSSSPGETRREQQEVARHGRQGIARCGPSESGDSRDIAFAELTVVVDPTELGLPSSEGKTPLVCPTFPCTLTQLLDNLTRVPHLTRCVQS